MLNVVFLQIIGSGNVMAAYFQTQLLRSLGYILDVEADPNFSRSIVSEYSYRKEAFDTSQFIHKSGTCFVQLTSEGDGFLLLKNRLFLSHRQGGAGRSAGTVGSAYAGAGANANDPAELRRQLVEICKSPEELQKRWEEMLLQLSVSAAAGAVGKGAEEEEQEETATEVAPSSYGRSEAGTIPSASGSSTIAATALPAGYPLPASLVEALPVALSEPPDEARQEE